MGRHSVHIRCRCCGKRGKHNARGLINACYQRHHNAGTLDQYPLPARPQAGGWVPTGRVGMDVLNRYIRLDARGFSPARIRFELGLSPRQMQRYAKAAREQREATTTSPRRTPR